MTRKAIHN